MNINQEDLRKIMSKGGIAVLLAGESRGPNRVENVIHECITHKMLNLDYSKAKGCLLLMAAGTDLTLQETEDISEQITKNIDSNADTMFGRSL